MAISTGLRIRIVLLAALLLAVAAVALQGGNPAVALGGSSTFPSTGSEMPLSPEKWDILNSVGTIIAKESQPNGWTVAYSANTFTVGAPGNATVATNYKVRYSMMSGGGGPGGGLSVQQLPPGSPKPTNNPWARPRTIDDDPPRALVALTGSALFDVVASATPPIAPSNLTAVAVGSTRVNLNWTDNSTNEWGFRVDRKVGASPTWATFATCGPNTTWLADHDVTPGTTYTYRVIAYNYFGDSNASNSASAVTSSNPASPPSMEGTQHWLALPGSGPTYGFGPMRMILMARGQAGTSCVVTYPSGATGSFTIPSTGTKAYDLDINMRVHTYDGIENKGMVLNSSAPVVATVLNYSPYASESFSALPTPILGTDYVIASHPGANHPEMMSEVAILATQNATTITVNPKTDINAGARPANVPFTITLNAGQIYQGKTYAPYLDLTGSTVTSDKPIAVYAGDQGTYVPVNVGYANPAIEQMLPTDRWGYNYYTVPLATRAGGEIFRIVASRKNTQVSVNGTLVATLKRGEFYETLLTSASNIIATKPILVAQYARGGEADGNMYADPFMVLVPAVDQFVDYARIHIEPNLGFADFVNVVLPTAGVGDFAIDGVIVAAANFTQIGTSTYSSAKLAMSPGSHVLVSKSGTYKFSAYGYGWAWGDSYAAVGGAEMPSNGGIAPAPLPPSGLTATAISGTRINLAWIDNSTTEEGFLIERKTGAGSWAEVGSVGPNVTTYADLTVLPITTYTYRVRAFNEFFSPYSNEASATTPDIAPFAPSGLVATSINAQRIDLVWLDNSNNETGFTLQRKLTTGGTWADIQTVAANTTSYSDTTGLTKLTQYSYRLRAFNTIGASAYSNTASATTKDTPPDPPSSLVATPYSWSRIDLTWVDNSTNETGFKVERKEGVNGTWTQIATRGVNSTTYSSTGLSGATLYYYRVRAYNAGGDSPFSNEASATTPNPPAPGAPTNLVATAVSTEEIDLTWLDNTSSEDGYRIERKGGASGTTWVFVANAARNATSFANTALDSFTTYTYRVRAYNVTASSAWSNEASATTFAVPNASGLKAVEPSSYYLRTGDTIEVRVSLYKNAAANTTINLSKTSSALTLPATVTIPSGSSSAVVSATCTGFSSDEYIQINAELQGDYAGADVVSVAPNAFLAVPNLIVTGCVGGVQVEWKAPPSGAFGTPSFTNALTVPYLGYKVYRKVGAIETLVSSSTLTEPRFFDSTLLQGSSAQYEVRLYGQSPTPVAVSGWGTGFSIPGSRPTWSVTPTSNDTKVSGQVTWTGHSVYTGRIYLNGTEVGSCKSADQSEPSVGTAAVRIPANLAYEITNHAASANLVVVLKDGTGSSATADVTVSLTPPLLSVARFDDALDTSIGEISYSRATCTGATAWTATLTDNAGSTRTWSGAGNVVSVGWNGKLSSGVFAAQGTSAMAVTFTVAGQPVSLERQIWNANKAPRFLGVVNAISSDVRADMRAYAKYIRDQIKGCYTTPDDVLVLSTFNVEEQGGGDTDGEDLSDKARRKIVAWLQGSVHDFYYYGHGTSTFINFGGMFLNTIPNTKGEIFAGGDIYVYNLSRSRQPFNAIILDACNSGGPDNNAIDPGTVSYSWFNAWSINWFDQGILAWNGYTRGFVVSAVVGIHDSNWKVWSYLFWTKYGYPGTALETAWQRTLQQYHGSSWDFKAIRPNDDHRLQAYGYAALGG